MFVLKPRVKDILRELLIAVVLFNAVMPIKAMASSSVAQRNAADKVSTKTYEAKTTIPRFVRPNSVNAREGLAAAPQANGAVLTCVSPINSYTTCSQISPNTVRIDFNVLSDSNNNDRGYYVHNSIQTDLYFWFHWDAGGFWYRYGYDANNTSQARGLNVGLNGLGYYYQAGYFAPVAGHGTYRTNTQGNYWIDGPFVGGDYVVDPKNWTLPIGVELITRNEVYDGKETKF